MDVRQILWDQLTVAKERKDAAAKVFDETMGDVPSGLPHPDGTQRIVSASSEFRHALAEYSAACKKLSAFAVHGIIPEDLRGELVPPPPPHRDLKNSSGQQA